MRSGQIEITATYLHFTDLIDTDAYRNSIKFAVDFCQNHDLQLRTAMHCDINGWPWSVADILAEYNIPNFCSQIHIDSGTDPLGKRGSVHYHWVLENQHIKSDALTRVPQGFWWVGPGNGRVFHWLNEHYMLGNVLGISSPQPFGADKTRYFYETDYLTSDDLYNIATREVPRYLDHIRKAGYAHNILLLSTGGYYIDNSRPDDRWLEVIAKWNANHEDVQLRTATISEWFEAVNEEIVDEWPSHRVAWPDHWAHGLGSATARIAQVRQTQRRRGDVKKLVELSKSELAAQYFNQSQEQELLSLEHTFGAWSTSARPEDSLNQFQQIWKDLTFHRAALYLDEAAGSALRSLTSIPKGDQQSVLVVPERSTSQHLVHFDGRDQFIEPESHVLVDQNNMAYPIQYDNEKMLQFVAVLPTTEPELNSFVLAEITDKTQVQSLSELPQNVLSNEFWTLQVNLATGSLIQLEDKVQQHNWVDAENAYPFGQIIHEQIIHPMKYHAGVNLARWVALGSATEESKAKLGNSPVYERNTVTFTPNIQRNDGDVFDSIMIAGRSDQLGQLMVTWRIYHQLPVAEMIIDWNKTWNDLPEATYVAFPFATTNARLEFETGGGFFEPGIHAENGQLPGTSQRYYTIQRAAHITDQSHKLLWLPVDAPLVMTNEINYSSWETDPQAWNGLLASMPVNHYWHTNFPVSQHGHIRLRYRFINPTLFETTETAIQSALPRRRFRMDLVIMPEENRDEALVSEYTLPNPLA